MKRTIRGISRAAAGLVEPRTMYASFAEGIKRKYASLRGQTRSARPALVFRAVPASGKRRQESQSPREQIRLGTAPAIRQAAPPRGPIETRTIVKERVVERHTVVVKEIERIIREQRIVREQAVSVPYQASQRPGADPQPMTRVRSDGAEADRRLSQDGSRVQDQGGRGGAGTDRLGVQPGKKNAVEQRPRDRDSREQGAGNGPAAGINSRKRQAVARGEDHVPASLPGRQSESGRVRANGRLRMDDNRPNGEKDKASLDSAEVLNRAAPDSILNVPEDLGFTVDSDFKPAREAPELSQNDSLKLSGTGLAKEGTTGAARLEGAGGSSEVLRRDRKDDPAVEGANKRYSLRKPLVGQGFDARQVVQGKPQKRKRPGVMAVSVPAVRQLMARLAGTGHQAGHLNKRTLTISSPRFVHAVGRRQRRVEPGEPGSSAGLPQRAASPTRQQHSEAAGALPKPETPEAQSAPVRNRRDMSIPDPTIRKGWDAQVPGGTDPYTEANSGEIRPESVSGGGVGGIEGSDGQGGYRTGGMDRSIEREGEYPDYSGTDASLGKQRLAPPEANRSHRRYDPKGASIPPGQHHSDAAIGNRTGGETAAAGTEGSGHAHSIDAPSSEQLQGLLREGSLDETGMKHRYASVTETDPPATGEGSAESSAESGPDASRKPFNAEMKPWIQRFTLAARAVGGSQVTPIAILVHGGVRRPAKIGTSALQLSRDYGLRWQLGLERPDHPTDPSSPELRLDAPMARQTGLPAMSATQRNDGDGQDASQVPGLFGKKANRKKTNENSLHKQVDSFRSERASTFGMDVTTSSPDSQANVLSTKPQAGLGGRMGETRRAAGQSNVRYSGNQEIGRNGSSPKLIFRRGSLPGWTNGTRKVAIGARDERAARKSEERLDLGRAPGESSPAAGAAFDVPRLQFKLGRPRSVTGETQAKAEGAAKRVESVPSLATPRRALSGPRFVLNRGAEKAFPYGQRIAESRMILASRHTTLKSQGSLLKGQQPGTRHDARDDRSSSLASWGEQKLPAAHGAERGRGFSRARLSAVRGSAAMANKLRSPLRGNTDSREGSAFDRAAGQVYLRGTGSSKRRTMASSDGEPFKDSVPPVDAARIRGTPVQPVGIASPSERSSWPRLAARQPTEIRPMPNGIDGGLINRTKHSADSSADDRVRVIPGKSLSALTSVGRAASAIGFPRSLAAQPLHLRSRRAADARPVDYAQSGSHPAGRAFRASARLTASPASRDSEYGQEHSRFRFGPGGGVTTAAHRPMRLTENAAAVDGSGTETRNALRLRRIGGQDMAGSATSAESMPSGDVRPGGLNLVDRSPAASAVRPGVLKRGDGHPTASAMPSIAFRRGLTPTAAGHALRRGATPVSPAAPAIGMSHRIGAASAASAEPAPAALVTAAAAPGAASAPSAAGYAAAHLRYAERPRGAAPAPPGQPAAPAPSAEMELRRQSRPAAPAPAAESPAPVQSQLSAEQLQQAVRAMPELDPERLADTVYTALMRRMKFEQRLSGY
ncbi:hypothetical protein COHCIP112018_03296 [Cohnella sp. JJ-181]|nr:hypothetical protein COHCIP112018_03296 [Cohnella sp. JJ-181]